MDTSIHPKWTGDVRDGYDAAILTLKRPVNLPVPRLASLGRTLPLGTRLSALGWGKIGSLFPVDLQIATNLTSIANEKCTQREMTESMMCAYSEDQDTTKGMLAAN